MQPWHALIKFQGEYFIVNISYFFSIFYLANITLTMKMLGGGGKDQISNFLGKRTKCGGVLITDRHVLSGRNKKGLKSKEGGRGRRVQFD